MAICAINTALSKWLCDDNEVVEDADAGKSEVRMVIEQRHLFRLSSAYLPRHRPVNFSDRAMRGLREPQWDAVFSVVFFA